MTEQAKRAIQQMKAAGFKRNEFFVRTERIYRAAYAREGVKNPYDYGATHVMVRCRFDGDIYRDSSFLIEEKHEAIIAAGLGVEKQLYASGLVFWLIRTEYSYQGKLTVTDLREWK